MPAFHFYWRLAVIAFLLLYSGYLVVRCLFPVLLSRPSLTRLLAYYVLGSWFVALFGLICFSIDIPNAQIRTYFKLLLTAATLGAFWLGGRQMGYSSLREHLRSVWKAVPRSPREVLAVLRPRLVFLVPVLFSIFVSSYYWSLMDPHDVKRGPWWDKSAARIGIHAEPVPVLQYFIAQNLVKHRSLETNFNLDGNQIWSAGDRPMFVGLTSATMSVLLRRQHLGLYAVHVMFMSSFIFIGLAMVLRQYLGLSPAATMAMLLCLAIQPFILNTVFYTVPKLPAAGFVVTGLALGLAALREERRTALSLMTVAGLALGCAVVCHESCLFGAFFVVLYVAGASFMQKLSVTERLRYGALLVVPLVCTSKFQSWFSHTYTRTSDLGTRVSLFLQGSFAYATPPMTMKEAARIYFEQYGWSGAIEHRLQSLRRGFLRGDEVISYLSSMWTVGFASPAEYFRGWNMEMMYTPVATYGIWVLPVLGLGVVVWLAQMLRKKGVVWLPEVAMLGLSVGVLFLFCALMACSSEVGSPQIPNSLHVFMFVGSLLVLYRMHWTVGWAVVGVLTTFWVVVHYFRDMAVAPSVPYEMRMVLWSGLAFIAMLLVLYRAVWDTPVVTQEAEGEAEGSLLA